MKIGLAFICGTETNQIEEMLDSVKSIPFSCISVVTDKNNPETTAILEKYGCKITRIKPKWKPDYSNWDFAKARQISYDNCDADWIIYLDTDDILINPEKLVGLIEANKDKDAILLPYDYEPNNIYTKERVIKKGKMAWRGLVHECLIPVGNIQGFISNDVIVKHNSVPNDRNKRNLVIIEREYQVAKTTRTVFYCGKDSLFQGEWAKSKKYFEELLTMSDVSPAEKHSALMFMTRMPCSLVDIMDYANRAIDILPDYAEPFFKLAWVHFQRGDYDNCIKYSKIGFTKICEAPFGMPYNKLELTEYPKNLMEEAMKRIGGNNMDVKKVSELKAMAYDQIAIIENAKKNLDALNIEIRKCLEAKDEVPVNNGSGSPAT